MVGTRQEPGFSLFLCAGARKEIILFPIILVRIWKFVDFLILCFYNILSNTKYVGNADIDWQTDITWRKHMWQ